MSPMEETVEVMNRGSKLRAKGELLSRAAINMRRSRDRRRRGIVSVRVEVLPREVRALIRNGWLDPQCAESPTAIREALYYFFGVWLGEK